MKKFLHGGGFHSTERRSCIHCIQVTLQDSRNIVHDPDRHKPECNTVPVPIAQLPYIHTPHKSTMGHILFTLIHAPTITLPIRPVNQWGSGFGTFECTPLLNRTQPHFSLHPVQDHRANTRNACVMMILQRRSYQNLDFKFERV